MKIIDIETGEIIKEFRSNPEGRYYTTQKHWDEYVEWCRLMEKRQTAQFFERYTKGVIDE